MKRTRMLRAVLGFSGLWCLSGCYMYSPYGQQPGMYAPQGTMPLQPIPQSSMALPQDQFLQPTIQSQPTIGASGQTFQHDNHDNSVNAPTPAAGSTGASDKQVPEPRDPSPTTSLEEPAIRTSESESPKVSRVATDDPVFLKPVASNDGELKPDSGVVAASMKGSGGSFDEDARFDHETQYRWLQGVAEYDPQRKTWHLIYDMSPTATDRLGGEVTLGGRLPFQMTDSNQYFRIHGSFDSSRLDQLAKPIYTISKVERLMTAN